MNREDLFSWSTDQPLYLLRARERPSETYELFMFNRAKVYPIRPELQAIAASIVRSFDADHAGPINLRSWHMRELAPKFEGREEIGRQLQQKVSA